MSEPQPMNGDGEWHVKISPCGTEVRVEAVKGCIRTFDAMYFISPPNRIERLFGITHASKINKAVLKCQKYCERNNALEKIAIEESAKWQKEEIR